ncbi:MAG: hypothetical protein ABF760_01900 [Zymomonas mobilis]|uniref:Putative flap endonuclease-1-like 5' DNA nuclease n=1 Tax=Zymomonas mobilis TaxID=542 RepID=A0A542VZQ6_ZYMMB|nr:hypothetical protein [Zymomonas mobilis]TQL16810.1 putative flap endonuclease-1-like 5' DNA nuclease [Zymomonas mobilis]
MTQTEIMAVAAFIVVVAVAVVIMFLARRRQKPVKTIEETQDEAQPPKLQRTFEPVAPPPAYQNLTPDKKEAEIIPIHKDIPIVPKATATSEETTSAATPNSERQEDKSSATSTAPVTAKSTENEKPAEKPQESHPQPEAAKIKTDIPAPANDVSSDNNGADKLTQIKGLGPKANKILAGLNITRFSQIAAWTEADIAEIDPKMGAFSGRIAREHWVEQAKLLDAGDIETFESKFGALHR